mmetsp:Transcript_11164/g.21958  ORF Transcript_11164/g.21958 Transcript_11164/m.21958 type:complete len:110 (-) Transcript_11164:932-1261(-)
MGCGQIKFHHIYAEAQAPANKPKPLKVAELPKETLPDKFLAEFDVDLGRLKPEKARVVKLLSGNRQDQIMQTGRVTPASTGSSQEDTTLDSTWRQIDKILVGKVMVEGS